MGFPNSANEIDQSMLQEGYEQMPEAMQDFYNILTHDKNVAERQAERGYGYYLDDCDEDKSYCRYCIQPDCEKGGRAKMLKEYCDRCGKEIPADDRERKTFDISYEERYQSFAAARFTLCKDCIEETGIKEAIGKARRGRREEKPKDTIEQLTDLIQEFLYKLEEGGSI